MGKRLLIMLLAAGLALTLSACGSPSKQASERIAEKAIEDATGGQADVDINNNEVNVETEEGSFRAGEEVDLPADFPSDVYVYGGTIKAVITNNNPKGHTVSIETADEAAKVKTAYEEKMREGNWDITGTMDFGGTISLAGQKGDRNLSVMIGQNEETTTIVLTTSEESQE
ncbi:MAG: hypothetical protein MUC28_03535 [Planctomycetes bacterium]|jgi:hypothetical protein|nr:hypothetical protein [Planctomycetota bacterium]